MPPLEDFSELIGDIRLLGGSKEEKTSISVDQTGHHHHHGITKISPLSMLDEKEKVCHKTKLKSGEGNKKQACSDKTIKVC